jgi:hypothetical protein
MPPAVNRRGFVAAAVSSVAAGAFVASARSGQAAESPAEPFRYCLNTSTIRGQNVGIVQEVELAAKAVITALNRGSTSSTSMSKTAVRCRI